MLIELTRDEAKAVEDFIHIELFESIRRDEEFDNLEYLRCLLNARDKMLKAIKEDEAIANF